MEGYWSSRARQMSHQSRSEGGFFDAVDSFLSDSSYTGVGEMDNEAHDGLHFGMDRIVPYNMMLTMYSRTKNADRFFKILSIIEKAGISPDIYTYNALFKLRANRGELEQLLQLATDMLEQNIRLDVVSFNILLEALGNSGWAPSPAIGPFGGHSGIASANRVLQMMSRLKIRRDPRTYEVMFNALFKVDLCEEILQLWDEMLLRGTPPTSESCCTVMKALYRCQRPDEALKLWYRVKNILVDYVRHLEGKGVDFVRTHARPRLQNQTGSHIGALEQSDPILPSLRTENIILDILKEAGRINAVFETWHLFRRADITPHANSCATLMELYLDIGDYNSGLNVLEWSEHVKIKPSARLISAQIALIGCQSALDSKKRADIMRSGPNITHNSHRRSEENRRYGISTEENNDEESAAPSILLTPRNVDVGAMSRIRQGWMALRALDTTFHPPQFLTFEAVIVSFYYAQDYIGVLDAFKVMQESLISRSPAALKAPNVGVDVSSTEAHPTSGYASYSNPPRNTIQRFARHTTPLRGTISIENLVLILESHKRAQYSYGSISQRLPEEVESVRILLGIQSTSRYEAALGADADELWGESISDEHNPLAKPSFLDDTGEHSTSYGQTRWKLTTAGTSQMFAELKTTPQPRFLPTSWNIAIPKPTITREEHVL